MNKPKHSLRATLANLAEELAEAVIAAARESLSEIAVLTAPARRSSQSIVRSRAARPEQARVPEPATRPASPPPAKVRKIGKSSPRMRRPRADRVAAEPAHAGPGHHDQLITDPQLLLAALDAVPAPTAAEAAPRKEPEILRSVAAVTPVVAAPAFAPVLREGEEIVRRSAGGVVLRRRRG